MSTPPAPPSTLGDACASDRTRSRPAVLGALYVANFGALAAYGPFLAVYLAYRGFASASIAELLAGLVLARLFGAPAWTLLADKLRSISLVLRIVSALALFVFAAVFATISNRMFAIVILVFGVFRAPFGALVDTLVLRWTARSGGTFGSLRAWGTLGYSLTALAMGALIARRGPGAVASATIVMLFVAALFTFLLPTERAEVGGPPLLGALGVLFRRPRFVAILVASALHQVGLAPYDALFPAYLTRLAGATQAGVAVGVGALAELAFMTAGGPIARRIGHARLYVTACAAGMLRWGLMALVTSPLLLIGLQVFHSVVFGAFYLSAVALVDRESPLEVRASAQGIFNASCFGIGAAASLTWAGLVEPAVGLRGVFAIAAVASGFAAVIAAKVDGA